MEFYEKLRKLRKEQGMSQEEIAGQLNVSRQAVSKWESGNGFPETDKLLLISNMFGVSLDYLLKSENPGEEKTENDGYYVNREMAYGYLAMKKYGAGRIALGVAAMVASLSFTMLFDNEVGTFLFLLGVAAGIAVLVLQGFKAKRYEEIEKQPLVFDEAFLREFRAGCALVRKRCGVCIAGGIVLIIASFAVNVLVEEVINLPAQYQAVYPVIWAIGIALLIVNGSEIIAHNVIAKNKEHIIELNKEQKSSWIYGTGFLLATAFFVAVGIMTGNWNPAWVVFPVTALVCTAVSIFLGSKEK